jgi:hypothetical protein
MSGKWSRKQRAKFNATVAARKKGGKRKHYRKPAYQPSKEGETAILKLAFQALGWEWPPRRI